MLDVFPSVLEQVSGYWVEHEPEVRNYNSGLALVGGRWLLCTRRFDREIWRSQLVLNELQGAKATRLKVLDLPRKTGQEHFEDGRLFLWKGQLHVAYTEGLYWQRPWTAVQKVARLRDDFSVEWAKTLEYGANGVAGVTEKNWQFFVARHNLYAVYAIEPHVVMQFDENLRVVRQWRTSAGLHKDLRGGSPPVLCDGMMVSFCHWHIGYRRPPSEIDLRRYGFSAYAFSPKPPFEVLAFSKPIAIASEDDPLIPNLAYPHWTPLVVFPCGAVLDKHEWIISAGVNDSYDVMLRISPKDIQWRQTNTKVPTPSALR